ncbi:hypothetical protein Tco_1373611, partial [Tanacetum coccineum]
MQEAIQDAHCFLPYCFKPSFTISLHSRLMHCGFQSPFFFFASNDRSGRRDRFAEAGFGYAVVAE